MDESAPFSLGAWHVHPALHRITGPAGETVRLEPRVMSLLVHLARASGRVVTRDDLLSSIWPDVITADEALTQAISILRRALGDSVREPRYIETVPKRGYRMIASVTPITEDAGHRETPRPLRFAAAAMVLLVVILVATTVRSTLRIPSDALPLSVSIITSTPGRETEPAIAPDGRQIAFVSNRGAEGWKLWLTDTQGSVPRRLTTASGDEASPAFSPDGGRLALVRHTAKVCRVVVLDVARGLERDVAGCSTEGHPQLAWMSAERLVMSDLNDRGVYALSAIDLRSGERSPLTTGTDGVGDRYPAVAADGTLAFARLGHMSAGELCILENGRPRTIARDLQSIRGITWLGASSILFAARRGEEETIWQVDRDGERMRWSGVRDSAVVRPTASPAAHSVAYEVQRFTSDLWIVALSGKRERRSRASSTRWDDEPRFSPDGGRLAFVSDRTGSREVWITEEDGDPRRLTSIAARSIRSLRWSPDGDRVAFAATIDSEPDVFVVDVTSGVVDSVAASPASEVAPAWTADGNALLFVSNQNGRWEILRRDLSGGVTGVHPLPATSIAEHRDSLLVTLPGRDGLWRLTTDGNLTLLVDDLAGDGWSKWELHRDAIWYVSSRSTLARYDLDSGRTIDRLPMADADGLALSVSPGRGEAIVARTDRSESDILLTQLDPSV